MIRVVHLFDVKPGIAEGAFLEWLDARLDAASRQFGCVNRRTWALLDGFTGSYRDPHEVTDRPKYANEAYWTERDGPDEFRRWLVETPEGRELHDRWFGSIQNHTVLRYVEGWVKEEMEG